MTLIDQAYKKGLAEGYNNGLNECEAYHLGIEQGEKNKQEAIDRVINMLNEEIKKEEKENGRYGMYYTVELYRQVLKMIEGEIYDS